MSKWTFAVGWITTTCSMCPNRVRAREDDERPLCDECEQYVIDWNDECDEAEAAIPSDAKVERED